MSDIADKLSNAIDDLIRAHVRNAMCSPDDDIGYDVYQPREALAEVLDEFKMSILKQAYNLAANMGPNQ